MKLIMQYVPEGILFKLEDKTCTTFPLNHVKKPKVDEEDWDRLNLAEQLWYDGCLTYDQGRGEYLLPAKLCTQLDDESKKCLRLPDKAATLSVFEQGNVGSPDYRICWAPLWGKIPVKRVTHKGAVIEYHGTSAFLTAQQYALVTAIDQYQDPHDIQGRARFQAQIRNLAERAGAEMDSFMQSREFLFVEEADYRLESDEPTELKLKPDLPSLPDELREALPPVMRPTTQFQGGRGRRTVFTSTEAQRQYNRISALPPLHGSAVPRFLDNPLSFLPEDIPFDAELFSQRVKGLKIKRSSAVPYLHVTPEPDRPGWFSIDTGFTVQSQDAESQLPPIEQTPEFFDLMHQAALAGEQYFFYQDQWVKVDPDDVRKFEQGEEELSKQGHSLPGDKCRYILDIYDNLDRMEYNEALLDYKKQLSGAAFQYEVPACFTGSLQPHQMDGYGFICAHHAASTGVLLADDMGLGKTVQVIAFLSYLYSKDDLATALLVMPKSLLENWSAEFRRFLPAEKKIYIHQGTQRYRSAEPISQYDVVMTTYETLARDQTLLATIPWTCVICDEVQRIKNFNTVSASAVKGMNTKCRIAMTGTPVENRLAELWSIVDFAQPGLLDSYQQFHKQYELPLSESHGQDRAVADALIHKLSPIFLRRTKDILGDRLPGKREETVPLTMDPASEKLYIDLIRDMKKDEEHEMILATIQKLLELCSHPRLLSGGDSAQYNARTLIRESPKLRWTVQKLKEIFARKEKVILFTKFKKMQALLRLVILETFQIDAKIINGEVKGSRLEVIEAFSREPGAGAIILSPRAAGVGLTITAANHVIHYTREWNPAVENQATDRAYRIGQTKPVTVYYPTMCSPHFTTVEERLDELLQSKRQLMKSVIIPADLNIKPEDFDGILSIPR